MGCDIHLHIEVKIKGKWEHYSAPRFPRMYWLFSIMAGVREIELFNKIDSPRGLPKDISLVTRECYTTEEIDAHSESWLSSEEWSFIIRNYLESEDHYLAVEGRIGYEHDFFGYLCGNGWDIQYKSDMPSWVEDYRIVFWFDN